jgi:hypothetical protein
MAIFYCLASLEVVQLPFEDENQSRSHITTDGQSASLSWCQTSSGAQDQTFIIVSCFVDVGRPL